MFFWVARMVMLGDALTGTLPFTQVRGHMHYQTIVNCLIFRNMFQICFYLYVVGFCLNICLTFLC